MAASRPFVDVRQRACTACGAPTFMSNAICPLCEDAADERGIYRCCSGFAEHFDWCERGAAVAAARRALAGAGVTRGTSWGSAA
jgi:hypothetical protein